MSSELLTVRIEVVANGRSTGVRDVIFCRPNEAEDALRLLLRQANEQLWRELGLGVPSGEWKPL